MNTKAFWGAATMLVGLALLPCGPSHATTLAEFGFGVGTPGTNVADAVAAHVNVSPMIVRDAQSHAVLAHDFVEVVAGSGNMAIHRQHGDYGGLQFLFDITVDPGYTFQITDITVSWAHGTYSGGARSLELTPNAEAPATLFSMAGPAWSDISHPASTYWNDGNWNALSARTDLTSLAFAMGFGSNARGTDYAYLSHVRLSGTLLPVPEPAALWMMSSGLMLVLSYRSRRRASCRKDERQ